MLGRKRHALVDTLGLLLNMDVHSAQVQDRDGAETLLRQARRHFPFIERIVGDGGTQGPRMAALVARTGSWKLEIIKRSDLHRFAVLPRRWIVERTLGLGQPQPSPVPGLRTPYPQGRRLRAPRHDPHHAQALRRKSLKVKSDFPDGL